MSALTTRDALAKAQCGECGHDVVMAHANWDERCGHVGCDCSLSWADALIASGAVVDAATLADDDALISDLDSRSGWNYGTRDALEVLATALSERSAR